MKIKIRNANKDGKIRLESGGDVKEVLINEDFLNPEGESIAVCFRGANSSGIIEFSLKELEKIYSAVKGRMHLIKGSRVFTD